MRIIGNRVAVLLTHQLWRRTIRKGSSESWCSAMEYSSRTEEGTEEAVNLEGEVRRMAAPVNEI